MVRNDFEMADKEEDYRIEKSVSGIGEDGDCPHCFNIAFNNTNNTFVADYIFNRLDTRICLILAYTFVFCCCFFGNLLVIFVVIMHRRMRTITNFFLTNLAVADLCVGLFCVYQNLSFYLTTHWAFGEFLCKMYHFIHSLSYTSSIAILIVISVERYVAIVHPMLSKQVMTLRRLRIVSATVWLVSAAYCSPRLIMYGTTEVPSVTGEMETICILKRSFYDSKTYDLANFIVCFVIPLFIISLLYFAICLRLWRSNQVSKHYGATTFTARATIATRMPAHSSSQPEDLHSMASRSSYDFQEVTKSRTLSGNNLRSSDIIVHDGQYTMTVRRQRCASGELHPATSCRGAKNHVLKSRRKVIRLLVSVVLTFAFCNLPFHARKLWQNWSPRYDGTSNSSIILTITTTLVMYMNSGINPFLYAILSENFRASMVDVLMCKLNRMHRTRAATRSLIRNEMNSTVRSLSISQDDIEKK
ncbi:trissin receptor-like [Stegodyphus dumicola]|uniref:trissin receptor-like n=1 Tax=Stegodyphus dumicola TaxID=202533 RepID=UPI0015B1B87D|nr:trissin receptor-like [Stegodyphus dumicola]